ncbi:universal stress protein [Mesonia aquimarina]|uniref:universal stress protein n=1 Tax=Mesonia aquimarina TaxID=1504967 RepID=UPI000EF5CA57|nr:universal stress protein [Mesonia aquimarina]
MNILLPTDFSQNSWNAIAYAVDFFKNIHANFYIIHINDQEPEEVISDGSVIEKKKSNTVIQSFQLLLQKLQQQKTNTKHHFYTSIEDGNFIESIRLHVAEKHINFIVMGTQGNSNFKEATVGSHTTDVITKVKCPILVIPENARFRSVSEIAFPTDFNTRYKTKILSTLKRVSHFNNSALSVLYVSKKSEELSEIQQNNKLFLQGQLQDIPHSFHYKVDSTLEEAVQSFVVQHEVRMIAMMAKNLNFFQHILFHPIAKKISYHKEIPFLVLHE